MPDIFCPKRGCEGYAKTVRREIIEGQFETILRRLQPSEDVFAAARAMFKTLWDRRLAADNETKRALEADLSTIEHQVEQFLDRIADTDTPSEIAAYKKRIRTLEERKLVVSERSRIAAGHCATSTKHLRLRSAFSQVLVSSGVRSDWRTTGRC